MPEASVDEDDLAEAREDEIWGAREITTMQTETETHPMDQ